MISVLSLTKGILKRGRPKKKLRATKMILEQKESLPWFLANVQMVQLCLTVLHMQIKLQKMYKRGKTGVWCEGMWCVILQLVRYSSCNLTYETMFSLRPGSSAMGQLLEWKECPFYVLWHHIQKDESPLRPNPGK